jgi:hypothetical protein
MVEQNKNGTANMGFFQKVSPILAQLDHEGRQERGTAWDKQVAQAIVDFGNSYGGGNLLQPNRKLIDYSDLATQTAYVFMYVAGHADLLHQVLARGGALLNKDEVHITSLGGGPGSDLLAVIELVRGLPPERRPRKIHYRVLDKQPNWHEILRVVSDLQTGTIAIEITFETVDVTVPAQWQTVDCANDDLFVMNFFVSEVCRLRAAASVRDCLQHLLGSLPTGAFVVFNDSAAFSFYEYFDTRALRAGRFERLLVENSRLDAEPDFDEVFRQAMDRFGRTPKLTSNAAYRVLRRQ